MAKKDLTSGKIMFPAMDPSSWTNLSETDKRAFLAIHTRFVEFTKASVDQQKVLLSTAAKQFKLPDLFSKWKNRRIGKLLKVDAVISGLTAFQVLNPLITDQPELVSAYNQAKDQPAKDAFIESLFKQLFEKLDATESWGDSLSSIKINPNLSSNTSDKPTVIDEAPANVSGIIKTNINRLDSYPLDIVI